MSTEVFELELCGGVIEARYRAQRPEVDAMPWGTLAAQTFAPELVLAAREAWTRAAFAEYRTGAACAATLLALMRARAPLDLIALATRFPLDEMVHTELCARMAMEFGGAIGLAYAPDQLLDAPTSDDVPLLAATQLVVSCFCVGEAVSVPLLHATAMAARHPLTKAVLQRIVRDEADHGTFGWTYLDWALPHLTLADLTTLGATAHKAIAAMRSLWDDIRARPAGPTDQINDLGWLATDAYLALAERSLQKQVLTPLRARGIHP